MKGVLVSNTGPIIALALIDRLDVIRSCSEEILVSDAVHKELLEGGSSNRGLSSYQRASWIKVRRLSFPPDPLLATVLDAGEASVIQLAREVRADYTLIDERKARKVARDVFGLKVVGTVRLLVEAKKNGALDSVKEALAEMRKNGYHIHDDIVVFALKEAGEL